MSPVTFTLVVLVLYLGGLKLLSYYAHRRSRETTDDYFLSGRGVGVVALVGTTLASLLSTGTVVSSPANFFKYGTGFMWVALFGALVWMMLAFGLRFWLLGRRHAFITPGELFRHVLGSRRVQVLVALVGLLGMLPYMAAQLVAIGITFRSLTGGLVSYGMGTSVAALAMAIYLYYGGARAVVWADVVQGFVFASLLAITAVLSVHWAGGFPAVVGTLMERAPSLARFDTPNYSVVEYGLVFVSLFCLPYIWQRMYMARSATALVRSIAVTPWVYAVLIVSCWTIGTSAMTLYPSEFATTDVLLGRLFHDHAPYLGAFVLVAAFAAGISSVDSQLLSSGSLLTRDLWQGGQRDSALEFRVARYTTLAILLVVYLASLGMEATPVMSLILLGLSLGVCQLPTLVALFFLPRCPEPAAFWSILAGCAVYLGRELLAPDWLAPVKTISLCAAASLVAFAAVYGGLALREVVAREGYLRRPAVPVRGRR